MFSGKTDDRGLWAGIQAGVLFFLAALACIYLSRQPATIAAIWLPNAILTAALLRAAAPVAGDPALLRRGQPGGQPPVWRQPVDERGVPAGQPERSDLRRDAVTHQPGARGLRVQPAFGGSRALGRRADPALARCLGGRGAGQRLRHGAFPGNVGALVRGRCDGHARAAAVVHGQQPGGLASRSVGAGGSGQRDAPAGDPGDQLRGPDAPALRLHLRAPAAAGGRRQHQRVRHRADRLPEHLFHRRADRPRRVRPRVVPAAFRRAAAVPADGLDPHSRLPGLGDHGAQPPRAASGGHRRGAVPRRHGILGDRHGPGVAGGAAVQGQRGAVPDARLFRRTLGRAVVPGDHLCGRPGTGPRPGARPARRAYQLLPDGEALPAPGRRNLLGAHQRVAGAR